MLFHRYCSLVAMLCVSSTSVAQTTTGDILGTVRDASGGLIPDAKVTVRNLDTNRTNVTITSGGGGFHVPLLSTGSYEVLVEKSGFSSYRQGPILLAVNQQADLDITLSISATMESVTVTSDPPLIDTTSAEMSTHFDNKRVAALPLSTNRNILNLAASIPGVAQISSGNSGFVRSGNQGTEGNQSRLLRQRHESTIEQLSHRRPGFLLRQHRRVAAAAQ